MFVAWQSAETAAAVEISPQANHVCFVEAVRGVYGWLGFSGGAAGTNISCTA